MTDISDSQNQTPNIAVVPNLGTVVLCGGRSTRLGTNKSELRLGPQTFLERIVESASLISNPIVLVGQVDTDQHQLPEGILIRSDQREDAGPLEGIRVGLKALSEHVDLAFVTSCDVPLLEPALIGLLHDRLGDHPAIVPFEGRRRYGMTAIYRTNLHRQIEQRIGAGQLRVSDLADAFGAKLIPTAELQSADEHLRSLTNINSVEDYFSLLREFGYQCPIEIEQRLKKSDR